MRGVICSFVSSSANAPQQHEPLRIHVGPRPRSCRRAPRHLRREQAARRTPIWVPPSRGLATSCCLLPRLTADHMHMVVSRASRENIVRKESFLTVCGNPANSQRLPTEGLPSKAAKSPLNYSVEHYLLVQTGPLAHRVTCGPACTLSSSRRARIASCVGVVKRETVIAQQTACSESHRGDVKYRT